MQLSSESSKGQKAENGLCRAKIKVSTELRSFQRLLKRLCLSFASSQKPPASLVLWPLPARAPLCSDSTVASPAAASSSLSGPAWLHGATLGNPKLSSQLKILKTMTSQSPFCCVGALFTDSGVRPWTSGWGRYSANRIHLGSCKGEVGLGITLVLV